MYTHRVHAVIRRFCIVSQQDWFDHSHPIRHEMWRQRVFSTSRIDSITHIESGTKCEDKSAASSCFGGNPYAAYD